MFFVASPPHFRHELLCEKLEKKSVFSSEALMDTSRPVLTVNTAPANSYGTTCCTHESAAEPSEQTLLRYPAD